MNKRIQELSKEAGVDAGQLFAEMLCTDGEVNVKIAEAWNAQPDEVRQRIFQVIEQNQQKFAELIVKECIGCCDGNGEYKNHTDTLFGQGLAEGIKISKAQIKQHFGVEE